MALIKCSECGNMISDKAESCPHCGNPITKPNNSLSLRDNKVQKKEVSRAYSKKNYKRLITFVLLLILLGGGAYLYYATSTEPTVVITEQFANKIRKYDKLGSFHDGLALAQRNGLWGYIDTEGNEVIPCIYKGSEFGNYGFDFSEGMAVIIGKDGKYGYINKKGEIVVKPQFQQVGNFSEGVASVFLDGKLNFIGKDGKYIQALSNKFIWDFNVNRNLPEFKNGVCEVHIPTQKPSEGSIVDVIYINKKGNEVEKPTEKAPQEFYVRYWEGDKVGYKDTIGNIVVPAKYTTLGNFSCGVAVATLEYGQRGHGMEEWYSEDYVGIYGYVDLNGNETFKQQDYEKIDMAEIKAKENKNHKGLRNERQEIESTKDWIQGNWRADTPYGEIRVGIADDCISVWGNGEHLYTGTYTIEGNHLVYDRSNGSSMYIIIDSNNQCLMSDENTRMQRFGDSNDSSYSEGNSNVTNTRVTFRTSTDVMSYLAENTFSNGYTTVKIDWDGMYTNGNRVMSGAPQVIRFSSDVALIKINLIPSGSVDITVIPSQGRIIDGTGDVYYVK